MKTRPMILGVVAVAAVAAVGAAVWMRFDTATPGDPADPGQVAQGAALYGAHCASCHGANLEGQPDWQTRKPDDRLPAPPHDETGHTWHHPDDVLFGIVKDGIAGYAPPGYESDMPAFGGALSDDEIWAVLAYIKSRWPAEIQQRQFRVTRQTRE